MKFNSLLKNLENNKQGILIFQVQITGTNMANQKLKLKPSNLLLIIQIIFKKKLVIQIANL